ncbi:MAG: DUF2752 domain-containing protein [Myxococcota bacterium]|nr:DUF2752 domain-containing protein [Myxococcota bacterium]
MDESGTTSTSTAASPRPGAQERGGSGTEGALSTRQKRRNLWTLLAWGGFLAACVLFPGSPANGIIFCPFRLFTGLSCPGCGMTRSCTSAVRFEFWDSLAYHPIGIPLILGFSVLALWRLVELVRGEAMELPPRVVKLRELAYLALFLFVLLFGGARLALEISGILTRW